MVNPKKYGSGGYYEFFFLLVLIIITFFLTWYLCAEFLDEIIVRLLNPESHENLMDYWFTMFVVLETLSVSTVIFCFFKARNRKRSI